MVIFGMLVMIVLLVLSFASLVMGMFRDAKREEVKQSKEARKEEEKSEEQNKVDEQEREDRETEMRELEKEIKEKSEQNERDKQDIHELNERLKEIQEAIRKVHERALQKGAESVNTAKRILKKEETTIIATFNIAREMNQLQRQPKKRAQKAKVEKRNQRAREKHIWQRKYDDRILELVAREKVVGRREDEVRQKEAQIEDARRKEDQTKLDSEVSPFSNPSAAVSGSLNSAFTAARPFWPGSRLGCSDREPQSSTLLLDAVLEKERIRLLSSRQKSPDDFHDTESGPLAPRPVEYSEAEGKLMHPVWVFGQRLMRRLRDPGTRYGATERGRLESRVKNRRRPTAHQRSCRSREYDMSSVRCEV